MYTFLIVVYVLVCFFMVIIVLLQQGKGSGMGATFGGGGQTLFGSRGQTTPLQKMTTIMAFLFMALSVLLATMSGGDESALYQPPADKPVGLQPAEGSGMGGDGAEAPPAEASDDAAGTPAAQPAAADAKPADATPAKAGATGAEPAKDKPDASDNP